MGTWEEAALGSRADGEACRVRPAQRPLWPRCLFLRACAEGAPGSAEDATGRDGSEAVMYSGFQAGHLTASLNSANNYQLKPGSNFQSFRWFYFVVIYSCNYMTFVKFSLKKEPH